MSSILALGFFSALSACSTYVEDTASAAFEPVFPTIDLTSDYADKSGAIYQQGQSGLFSADRRARNVGDILTVDFNEVFAATKAQSTASSKSDSFDWAYRRRSQIFLQAALRMWLAEMNQGLVATQRNLSAVPKCSAIKFTDWSPIRNCCPDFENGNMGILGQKK